MKATLLQGRIRDFAEKLDQGIEKKDMEFVVSCFAEDCEIEILGVCLRGKNGVRNWLTWLYKELQIIKFEPIIIIVDGDIFFEEFIVHATLKNNKEIRSKQSEVLIYNDNYQICSLRIYFDRLDFADAIANNFISRSLIKKIKNISEKGLVK